MSTLLNRADRDYSKVKRDWLNDCLWAEEHGRASISEKRLGRTVSPCVWHYDTTAPLIPKASGNG
jgi:hypothetical protein